MMLPMGCLDGCLLPSKVAYFRGAESHREFRQYSSNLRSRSEVSGLPPLATGLRQATQSCLACCLTGCQTCEVF